MQLYKSGRMQHSFCLSGYFHVMYSVCLKNKNATRVLSQRISDCVCVGESHGERDIMFSGRGACPCLWSESLGSLLLLELSS